jgi:hypothetical protein
MLPLLALAAAAAGDHCVSSCPELAEISRTAELVTCWMGEHVVPPTGAAAAAATRDITLNPAIKQLNSYVKPEANNGTYHTCTQTDNAPLYTAPAAAGRAALWLPAESGCHHQSLRWLPHPGHPPH